MSYPSDTVLEVERVREVAAVFRSRDALHAAIDDLLLAGFDRADIDLVADPDAVQRRLGTAAVPAGSSSMGLISSISTGARPVAWTASSKARSRAIFPCRTRPSSNWRSTSRLRRRSV